MKLIVLCHYIYGLFATLRTRHLVAFVATLATISAFSTLYSAVFMTVHPQSPLSSENWLSLQISIPDSQSSTTNVPFGILHDFTTKSPETHRTTESRIPAEQLPTETSISVAILNAASTEASSSRSVTVPKAASAETSSSDIVPKEASTEASSYRSVTVPKKSSTETSSTVIALKASSTTKRRSNIQRRTISKVPAKSNSIVIASRAEGRIPAEASSSATVPKDASTESSSTATALIASSTTKRRANVAHVIHRRTKSIIPTDTSSYVTALKGSSPTKRERYFPGVDNQKTERKIPAKSSNIAIAHRATSTNKNFKIPAKSSNIAIAHRATSTNKNFKIPAKSSNIDIAPRATSTSKNFKIPAKSSNIVIAPRATSTNKTSLNAKDRYDRKPSVSLRNIPISYPVACNETNCLEFLSQSETKSIKECGQMTSKKQSGVKIEQSICKFLPYKDRAPVALSSPPGSGNTWLRGLLERATGVCTGYHLCDTEMRARGFLGEKIVSGKVLVVKTHSSIPQWVGERVRVSWEGSYGSAVLLIRNPVQAVIAEWNRIMTIEMKKNGTQTNGSHINVVSAAIFGRWSGAR